MNRADRGMDLATGVVPPHMSDFNTQVIEEFRANHGKVGGNFAGASLVLMTTVGAKSGVERTNPVVYFTDADRIYVIASAGGSTKHPAWYHNLIAHPELTLEIGDETYRAKADPVTDDAERDRLYANAVSQMPGFGEYEKTADRRIPVLYLDRV